jgi:pimeloyl-ACP methyl ester carboxylesterase
VIGITRRGFGKSSKPKDGYSEEIRVKDYISILDQLNIPNATFAAHSIGCGELNYLGSHYQDRINKLVYLDGLDYGEHKLLNQPPRPDYTDDEAASLEKFIPVLVRYNGYREPNAAICNIYATDNSGRVVGTISPPDVSAKIVESSVITDYSLITAPVLGIFETWTMQTRLPYYWYLDKEKQAEYDSAWVILFDWRAKQLNRIRTEIKNSRVIEVQNSYHYVYINNEAEVAREMRKFLSGE